MHALPTHVNYNLVLLRVVNRREQYCASPGENVVLPTVNIVVLAVPEQCCQQGCSAMITMLLQHRSTINLILLQLVNKVEQQ